MASRGGAIAPLRHLLHFLGEVALELPIPISVVFTEKVGPVIPHFRRAFSAPPPRAAIERHFKRSRVSEAKARRFFYGACSIFFSRSAKEKKTENFRPAPCLAIGHYSGGVAVCHPGLSSAF